MSDETTYNRRPVEMYELRQPRCGLRFGVAPCAARGTPKCYNTFTTCRDTENYDPTGEMRWRFVKPENEGAFRGIGDETGNVLKTTAIPCLVSTSRSPTRVNIGSARDGESPFGVRSTLSVQLKDIPWTDPFGDYYRSDRTDPNNGTLFGKFNARNEFVNGMTGHHYAGYAGQAIDDMQQSLFVPEKIDGPDASGSVRIANVDPLQLADSERSLFPRTTDITLKTAIDSAATTVAVFSSEADVTDAFGNTTERYIRAGDEIFSYTTATLVDATSGEYSLTGVVRGVLFTEAASHEDGDTLQRVGRYEAMPFWEVGNDLLVNHTPAGLKASYIPFADWVTEGERFLGIFRATGTVPEPTSVTELCGELSQQGLFSIWWDERTQTIPLKAVKPPQGDPVSLNDVNHLLTGSVVKSAPKERLTRVQVYYRQRNPTRSLTDVGNYPRGAFRIEESRETPEQGGEVRTKTIYSRWIREDALAIQLARRLLQRFLATPRYLTIKLDAKDRSITVGSILNVTQRTVTDSEGNVSPVLWQVISEEEIVPGQTVVYDCQTFSFVGRFAVYMADGSGTYLEADETERKLGAWYAGADGKMSNGDDGFNYQ